MAARPQPAGHPDGHRVHRRLGAVHVPRQGREGGRIRRGERRLDPDRSGRHRSRPVLLEGRARCGRAGRAGERHAEGPTLRRLRSGRQGNRHQRQEVHRHRRFSHERRVSQVAQRPRPRGATRDSPDDDRMASPRRVALADDHGEAAA